MNVFGLYSFKRARCRKHKKHHSISELDEEESVLLQVLVDEMNSPKEKSSSPEAVAVETVSVVMVAFIVHRVKGKSTQSFMDHLSTTLTALGGFQEHVLEKEVLHCNDADKYETRFLLDCFPNPECLELLEKEQRVSNIVLSEYECAINDENNNEIQDFAPNIVVGELAYRRTSCTQI